MRINNKKGKIICTSKYRGDGIEDDVLVTEDGNLNLTAKVPKDADEIEELMNKGKAKSAKK